MTLEYRADPNKEIHHEVPIVRCGMAAESDLHRTDSLSSEVRAAGRSSRVMQPHRLAN